MIRDVELAEVLTDGSLICKNAEQKNEALKLQMVCKKEVIERLLGGKKRNKRSHFRDFCRGKIGRVKVI